MAKKPIKKVGKKPSKKSLRKTLDDTLKQMAVNGTILATDLHQIAPDFQKWFTQGRVLRFVEKHKIKFCAGCEDFFKSVMKWAEPPASIFRPVH